MRLRRGRDEIMPSSLSLFRIKELLISYTTQHVNQRAWLRGAQNTMFARTLKLIMSTRKAALLCLRRSDGALLACFILSLQSICCILLQYIDSFRIFLGASSSPLLLRGAPDYSIDTVSELTRRSATGNCE